MQQAPTRDGNPGYSLQIATAQMVQAAATAERFDALRCKPWSEEKVSGRVREMGVPVGGHGPIVAWIIDAADPAATRTCLLQSDDVANQ